MDMTTQNVNKNAIVTPDTSSTEFNKIDLSKCNKKIHGEDASVDPFTLRDSLENKKKLIEALEKGKYANNNEFKDVRKEIDRALADLNIIIDSLS